MCLPALAALPAIVPALLSAATTAATGAISMISQNQQQNAQIDAQNQQARLNMQAARDQYGVRSAATAARQNELQAQEAAESFETKVAQTRAGGEARAAFAGRGVGGGALDSVLRDYAAQGGRSRAASNQRLRFAGGQLAAERAGNYAGLKETYASNPLQARKSIGIGDWAGLALNSASAGMGSSGTKWSDLLSF